MKVLVTGATGTVGRRAAAELARKPEVEKLVVAGRDGSNAARIATLLGGTERGVEALELDVADRAAFVRAANEVDVVAACAGPFYLFESDNVRAAIDAGVHYVSLCDDYSATRRALAYDDDARDADVTIISGCGLSPGITNLLVAVAAEELDQPDEIGIALGISSADASGDASALHFVLAMDEDAPAISDYTDDLGPAGTSPRLVYFPEPVGWVETFRAGHPEVATMPRVYPKLRTLRFRMGLTERVAMDVVRASVATGLLNNDRSRRLWLRMSSSLRPFIESLPPRGPSWTAARVDVRGSKSGRSSTVSLGVVDRIGNLAAIPLAGAVVEVGTGTARSGVRSPEEAFDPRSFLKKIAQRGIRIARLEPERV